MRRRRTCRKRITALVEAGVPVDARLASSNVDFGQRLREVLTALGHGESISKVECERPDSVDDCGLCRCQDGGGGSGVARCRHWCEK